MTGTEQPLPIDDTRQDLSVDIRPGPPTDSGTPSESVMDGKASPPPRRLSGLDAARGFALLSMLAVHTLPAYHEATASPTLWWSLFAGHSAQLFGLLAGVAVALITGGSSPHTGRTLLRSRISLATRALILMAVGVALNHLPLAVYNILPYYGAFFLIAILFTGLGVRGLLVSAAVSALVGPLLILATRGLVDHAVVLNPTFAELMYMPGDVVLSLFVTGAYPGATWLTYIFLGLAVGRLDLRRLDNQARLCAWGGILAAGAMLTSEILIKAAGGWERLVAANPGMSEDDIASVMLFGGEIPPTTAWWLSTDGPHTNTQLAVIASAGLALFALGIFLIVSRGAGRWLDPLAAAGAMTFTLYSTHVVFLAYVDVWEGPMLWCAVQVAAAVAFALVWRRLRGRGPLEAGISKLSKSVGRAAVPTSL